MISLLSNLPQPNFSFSKICFPKINSNNTLKHVKVVASLSTLHSSTHAHTHTHTTHTHTDYCWNYFWLWPLLIVNSSPNSSFTTSSSKQGDTSPRNLSLTRRPLSGIGKVWMKECEGRVSANVLMSLNVQSHSSDDSVKPPANRRPHSSAVKSNWSKPLLMR